MSQAWEKFHLSMYILVGAGTQRERLVKAYKSNLAHLSKKDMPSEIKDEFVKLSKNISSGMEQDGECKITKTVNSLDDKEVAAMINSIIRMYDALTRYQPILHMHQREQHQPV
ncbi:MAG: hypothetical protein JWQ21_2031 [Herminiimonas sp.]|nr:hypothetical protein [Herminiimonas sp.]